MTRSLSLLVLLTGCPDPLKDATINLADANNYSYAADIEIGTVPTAIATDITAHWDNLDTDIQGHAITSCDDIDHLQVVWFQYLTLDELEEKVICNNIKGSDADVATTQDPEEEEPSDCQAMLSETKVVGNAFIPEDYYAQDYGVWLAQALTGSKNYRMVVALEPSADNTETDFSFENDSSVLDFSTNLHDLSAVTVPESALSYTVDWSGLVDGANADGCEPSQVYKADTLWLARFDSMTVAELEDQFLDLELIADEIWTTGAGAVTSADLGEAVSATDGSTFEGFSSDATWVIALRATTSVSPAPVFLTVLNVE